MGKARTVSIVEAFFRPERIAEKPFSPVDISAGYSLDVSMAKIGSCIATISLLLIAVSIVQSTDPHESFDAKHDNDTRFVRENIQLIYNGTYLFGDDAKYATIQPAMADAWLIAVDRGMERYNYGNSFDNFCWNRTEVSQNVTFPSLFRSSQLFVSVQVPMRVAVLLSLVHRLVLLPATLHQCSRGIRMLLITVPLAIFIEFLHLTGMSTMFTIHMWQDNQNSYLTGIALTIAIATLAAKMVFLSGIKGPSMTTLCRLGIAIATLVIGRSVLNNWQNFVAYPFCDQMVSPMVAISEWLFVLMMLASYALDLVDGRSLRFMIDEFAEETPFYTF
ncbi:hypothetical protein V3C99_010573 [Haemonchus contortus]